MHDFVYELSPVFGGDVNDPWTFHIFVFVIIKASLFWESYILLTTADIVLIPTDTSTHLVGGDISTAKHRQNGLMGIFNQPQSNQS